MSGRVRYGAVLRRPHVPRVAGSALIARAPVGVNGLAIILFIRSQYDSYATAGAVAAGYALGAAVVAPFMGRLVDRHGPPRVLLPLAFVHAAAMCGLVALGLSGAPVAILLLAALLAGSAIPPVGSVLRALWPVLMGDRQDLRTAAFALDAVMVELSFVIGPLVVAATAALASPQAALLAGVVLVLSGTTAFAGADLVRRFSPAGDHAHDTGGRLGALRSPGVRTLVLSTLPFGFCLGAAEVAFPAFGEFLGDRALAGPLIAIWSLASAIAGLAYGAYGHEIPLVRVYLAAGIALPLVTFPLALPSTFAVMVPLALLAGLAVAPLLTAGNQLIGEVAPKGALTEAYTWPLTALVGGVAVGNAVSGAIVQAADWRVSFVIAGVVGLAGTAIALARRRTLT